MQWIPVSERVPEKNLRYVLCSIDYNYSYKYTTKIAEYVVGEGFGKTIMYPEDDTASYYTYRTIAWMEIPSIENEMWNNPKNTLPTTDITEHCRLLIAQNFGSEIIYKTIFYKDDYDYFLNNDVIAWMIMPDPYLIPRPNPDKLSEYIYIDSILEGDITEFDYIVYNPKDRYRFMQQIELLSKILSYDKCIDVYDLDHGKFKVVIRDSEAEPYEYYLADKDFTVECRKLKYGHLYPELEHYLSYLEKVIVYNCVYKYEEAIYLFPEELVCDETCKWINATDKEKIKARWKEVSKYKVKKLARFNDEPFPF